MNLVTKYKSWWIVILFGIGYAVVGIAFPNPSAPRETQLMWRLAAWITSAIIFGIQIWCGHFWLHNPPRRTALHTAVAAALGAFALAAAANIHALYVTVHNRHLLAASLVLWPIITGVPAFVAAIIIAAVLEKIKPIGKPQEDKAFTK